MKDFSINFTVDQSAGEVFNAITNVRGWWSQGLKGNSLAQGDEFEYRHGQVHYSRHRLTELVPGRKVVWLTVDSKLTFVADTSEWNGTMIVFEISEDKNGTTLTFTHRGLTPDQACYEGCSNGWAYYIDSLRQLIITGKGKPDRPETGLAD